MHLNFDVFANKRNKIKTKINKIIFTARCHVHVVFGTITLSDDGTAYSFGVNSGGELGLGLHNDVSLPTPIPNLPKISQVSCGSYFTVCVDYEGFIWSFGENYCGQLGTGNKTDRNVPQKLEIPPVLSVACGSSEH